MIANDEGPDFLRQMHLAVQEEAPLWEVPLGSTDLLPSGPVVHGPWEASECAFVLSRWLERGWLELYLPDHLGLWDMEPAEAEWFARTVALSVPGGRFHVLAVEDARKLLAEPTRWSLEHPDGHVCISFTTAGLNIDDGEWLAAAT